MAHLTDLAIRRSKPALTKYDLKDGAGLYLTVKPNGTKSWYIRFYWQGKQQRKSLGLYPAVDLKDARSLRQKAHDLLDQEIDPRAYKMTAEQTLVEAPKPRGTHKRHNPPTIDATPKLIFAEYAQQWKAFKFKKLGLTNPNGRQSTQSQIERYLRLDMIPVLGRKAITEITRADLLKVQRKIEKRGALSIAEKCRSWLNEIFRHAIAEGHIDMNPASEMDMVALPQPPTLHNPFLRMDELPKFLNTLVNYRGSRQTQLGIRLLLLTGVRTGELRQARPEHFDLNNAIWRIPAENVKQLQRRARRGDNEIPPYLVPLSKQALEIIQELLNARFNSQRYILCSRSKPKQTISENTLNQGLQRMGYKDRLTGHGIRATISTALNEMNYPKDWIEAQLSHSDKDQIRATYNHAQYVEQRRGMMQAWADQLDSLGAGAHVQGQGASKNQHQGQQSSIQLPKIPEPMQREQTPVTRQQEYTHTSEQVGHVYTTSFMLPNHGPNAFTVAVNKNH